VNSLTQDRFLNGRIIAQQLVQGYRSGLDAVMLAAAVPAILQDEVLELGCGVGVASLCLGARCISCGVTGIEINPKLASAATTNARANAMESRIRFLTGDALELPPPLRRDFDHVFANPPFHDEAGKSSPDNDRATALADRGRLGEWLSTGLKRVRSQGTFTVILRADRLGEALCLLPERGIVLFPLWPRKEESAKRIIMQVRKDARTPPILLPGLVLHESDGRYTPAADAILRDGASLAL